jgi:flagellin-like hook-associated protein FlgL
MAHEVSLTSAMRANLLSLQKTVSLLNRTQERLSTGKKVNSPLDNPTSYFAAQAHINRANDLAARKDSMGEALQTVASANSGIESITTLIESAKGIAQAALGTSDATARAAYVTQYNEVLGQIDSMANDSGYRGTNLLKGDTLTVQFNEDGTSALDLDGFDATTTGLSIGAAAGWADPVTGTTAINASLTDLSDALGALRVQSSSLSSNLGIIQTRADWADQMIATLKAGAGALTDADMNEEGVNLLMLQTRQALATTALSLSAENAKSVLELF